MHFIEFQLPWLTQTWGGVSILLGGSFLTGGIPFGYIAGKIAGIDIREHGSKNIGATNVFRVLGAKWGIPVFTLDALKGVIPTLLAWWSVNDSSILSNDVLAGLSGLAAVLGHTFTPFLNFKGGKGVATSTGFMAALLPVPLLIVAVTWWVVFAIGRMVSLASLLAVVVLPIATVLLYPGRWFLIGLTTMIAMLVFITHRTNIQRLIAGKENRFGGNQK